MTDMPTPANSNTSLSQIMGGKQRKLIEDALAPTIHLLSQNGIAGNDIADVLFRYMMSYMVPPEGADASANVIWYAQLQRFRDALQDQIGLIEGALDHD